MRKFEVSKPTFSGKIEVIYNGTGILEAIDFTEADMTPPQIEGFKARLPVLFDQLESFSQTNGCNIREKDFKVTFEMWYNDYALRRNKEPARLIWEKMSSEEQLTAWLSNKKYKKYCKKNANWYNQMYPDTYLRKKHYFDEWDKI